MKKILIIIVFIAPLLNVFADSPLTSTTFYEPYLDIQIVKEASASKGRMTNEMMEYIGSDTNPLDIKLAIINAIGWEDKVMMTSKMFFMYVMNKKKYQTVFGGEYAAFEMKATNDELICFAYMKSLDNYFDVVDAFEIAGEALRKSPNSFAVNMIYNLIKAQGLALYGEYCYASQLFLAIKDNPKLKKDVREDSLNDIFEYMTLIGNNCEN
jgi:hypothetical protein